ncbi:unnamed protein product [Brassica rapa subsp. narinosa]|uniref:(rape) hypothetical protein n=1 Tax=Brassica napus TaxID=3708 RepID=A0A816YNU0_BRANA|nr:unnamed protein product [Brassica napus]
MKTPINGNVFDRQNASFVVSNYNQFFYYLTIKII